MKKLILIRHADTFEQAPNQKDKERVITRKGEMDALKMGMWLKQNHALPQKLFSSSALRAEQTAKLLAEQWGMDENHLFLTDDLYNISIREMMGFVNALDDSLGTAALIGHNPTLTYFTEYVTGANVNGFSPGTAAVIAFTLDSWQLVGQHSGSLDALKEPEW